MEQIITCINCPVGCRMTVALNDQGEVVSVSGNTFVGIEPADDRFQTEGIAAVF